jgi:hypothetical protein
MRGFSSNCHAAWFRRVPELSMAAHVADRVGVSPATLYRYLPAARTANGLSPRYWSRFKRRNTASFFFHDAGDLWYRSI